MAEQKVRLSRFVCFVPYESYVEVHHGARNTCQRIPHAEHQELLAYTGFTLLQTEHRKWLQASVLVGAGMDHRQHHGLMENSEAELAHSYQQWYWQHEIESQREYRWLGQVAVKMPMDLFFYQELIFSEGTQRILELGYGKGGGLYFFHSIQRLLKINGLLVGVDKKEQCLADKFSDQRPQLIHGDASSPETLKAVKQLCAEFDLIVIDIGGMEHLSLQVLSMWSQILAVRGIIVVEDTWGEGDKVSVTQNLDNFLLSHPQFALYQPASRYPLLKGVALTRTQEEAWI